VPEFEALPLAVRYTADARRSDTEIRLKPGLVGGLERHAMAHLGEQPLIRVISLAEHERRCGPIGVRQLAAIDCIFFSSSTVQSFAGKPERLAFRERWLGRYLAHYRDAFFVALAPDGVLIGYLAGCLQDPVRQPLFDDIGYFAHLADLTTGYPAHLHINVDAAWRSHGVGTRLIAAFCDHASTAGIPGVHVVTGAHSRNVAFYQRVGFRRLRSLTWNGSEIVCLGRELRPRP
jgi:GNAT superfamily N-acetyltransferase